MKVTVGHLRSFDGHLPSALFARGWGNGNFKKWMEGGGADHWGLYFERLFTGYFPVYSKWLSGWLQAGQPQNAGTVKSKGKSYSLQLAVHDHGGKGASFPAPYDGTYKAHGHERTYRKVSPGGGAAPDIGPASGIGGSVAGGLAGASLLGGALVLAGSEDAQQAIKKAWKAAFG